LKYASTLSGLLIDIKSWLLVVIGALTILVISYESIKYLAGDGNEKAEALGNIKKTLAMGGGIFFLIWLSGEVISRFQNI